MGIFRAYGVDVLRLSGAEHEGCMRPGLAGCTLIPRRISYCLLGCDTGRGTGLAASPRL